MMFEDTPFNPTVTEPEIVDNSGRMSMFPDEQHKYEEGGKYRWEIYGDFRRYLDCTDNDEVMAMVVSGLSDEEMSAVYEDATIDPEMCCFYIYASRRETLEPVLREIERKQGLGGAGW